MGPASNAAEAEACIVCGDGLEEAGDLRGAALEFTRATQLDPSDTEAWSSLGNVLRGLAHPAEAAVAYERAAASNPTDPDLLLYRAAALSRCGELEEAARCIDAALELMLVAEERDAGAVADGWVSRGVAAFGLGHIAEAVACYDRALTEVPGHECAASQPQAVPATPSYACYILLSGALPAIASTPRHVSAGSTSPPLRILSSPLACCRCCPTARSNYPRSAALHATRCGLRTPRAASSPRHAQRWSPPPSAMSRRAAGGAQRVTTTPSPRGTSRCIH
jgi:tetratricopeptide (TPR) repeat protein